MFVLNDTPVDPKALHSRLDRTLNNCAAHRYAIHMNNTGTILSTLLYLRDKGAGVFPIHPDIPAETARMMAQTAGCDMLLAEGLKQVDIAQPTAAQPGVLVQMSSGTTGAAKVITRRWDDIATEVAHYADFFTKSAQMTPVIACPITHSYGLIPGVFVAQHRGHTPIVIDGVNPKYILRRLRETQNPVLYTSPAMLHTLARLLPRGQVLNAAVTSGTVLPDAWFDLIRGRTTHFFQQYGCSEAGCIAINQDLRNPYAVGHPLPHLNVTAGPPEAPAAVMVSKDDRTIDTGDLGSFDETGMLVFAARADDMINVAGMSVYPQDIEKAVMAVPGVLDAVAFRIDDVLSGSRAGLVYAGHSVTEDEVRKTCQANLASFQQPAFIKHLSALPREANGKISRRAVAAQYAPSDDLVPA
ncbi:fatty-acyl-CoA synthase [Epibacterium ulvae]|uniref:Fatty-acyl-CoA synthase n=1 Tax=Epibacterium ulvae TaxID=1156985 RepID=A0A1G5QSD2_9RHOB|nr:AMP-binding protein [Epibacterium ulvae]SCZ64763.1 fatty-acyl-CoA synthase [Epibacterium ulvae]